MGLNLCPIKTAAMLTGSDVVTSEQYVPDLNPEEHRPGEFGKHDAHRPTITANGAVRDTSHTAAGDRDGPITVMVVDGHEVVRRGVYAVVKSTEGMTVVAEAGSVSDGIRRAALTRPRVILIDLELPDGTGLDLMRSISTNLPQTRAIVLTSFDDGHAVAAALEAGAAAYLLKSVRCAEIIDTIRATAAGRTLLDQRTIDLHRSGQRRRVENLTAGELKVLDLIGEGLSNREIGAHLGLAEKTVKNRITSLLDKMGLQRRTQAAAWVAARKPSWRMDPAR